MSAIVILAVLVTSGFYVVNHTQGIQPTTASVCGGAVRDQECWLKGTSTYQPSRPNAVAERSDLPRIPAIGSVAKTLDLINSSLLPGNQVPMNGITPEADTYDSGNGDFYVADSGSNLVSVINATRGEVIASIPVGNGSGIIQYDDLNGLVYLDTEATNSVTVINGTLNRIVGNITVGAAPYGIAIDSDSGKVFISDWHASNVSVIDGSTNKVIATITGVQDPYGEAYDSVNNCLYVTSLYSGNVSVFNATTLASVGNISLGLDSYPYAVAIDPKNDEVVVSDSYNNTVSIINGNSNTFVENILIGGGLNSYPSALLFDPDNGQVYITDDGLVNVTTLDPATNVVTGAVVTGLFPDCVAYDPHNREVYVTNFATDNVSVIDGTTETDIGSIQLGVTPFSGAYDPLSQRIFVTESDSDNLAVINSSSDRLVTNVTMGWDPIGAEPFGVTLDPANGNLYVAHYGVLNPGDNMIVVNGTTDRITATIPQGFGPRESAYDPVDGDIYVADSGSNNVSVINPIKNTVFGSIQTSFGPGWVAVDPSNSRVYVVDWNSNETTVIDGNANQVVGGIAVGSVPYSDEFDPANGYLYVVNSNSNNVSVINATTDAVIGSINVGSTPEGIAYDQFNGYLYIANSASDTISVIDGFSDKVVGTIPVGVDPTGIAANPVNGQVIVTDEGSGSLSIINPPAPTLYPILFNESGLPAHTNWTFSLDGENYTSMSSTTTLSEPNGTYLFTVAPVQGYTVSPSSGDLKVDGNATMVRINFTSIDFAVTFVESGLPSGMPWTVSLNGVENGSKVPEIGFSEPQGFYTFSVASTLSGTWGIRYAANITSGDLVVSDAVVVVHITYSAEFLLTLKETGAGQGSTPSGGGWYDNGTSVNITAASPQQRMFTGWLGSGIGSYSGLSKIATIGMGGPVNETARYVEVYQLTVNETGLSPGTQWSVTVNGTTNTTLGQFMTFSLTNGTFIGSVATVTGYSVDEATFSVTVNGTASNATVHFKQTTSTQSPSAFPEWAIYLAITIALMVVVAMGALILRKGRGSAPENEPSEEKEGESSKAEEEPPASDEI